MFDNFILSTDSYKVSHWKQYPPGTQTVYSYLESRGGKYNETVFFGLQYYLNYYLSGHVVFPWHIDEAEDFCNKHFGEGLFNRAGWEYIVNQHSGRLPLRIRAVREGTVVPTHNVLMTIENTDPNVPWLTNYAETLLLKVWYPITVATLSRNIKKIILGFLEATGDPDLINFKLHDFGFRGASSYETAAIGGAAHLVNFMGTDTMAALEVSQEFYDEDMAGFSIPASEHSTITSWGEEHELDAMRNMLTAYPTGLVACVSDSFDIYRACRQYWGDELHDMIMQRDGTLVVRPDSGDPPTVVTNVLGILGEKFGYTVNRKGYKVLPSQIRVIQGDGVNEDSIYDVLTACMRRGWSADNVTFGMGGKLLQDVNRDTQKFAFKCSAVQVNGEWRDVYKDPVTDPGKISKRGRLSLVMGDGGILETESETDPKFDYLQTVFENGVVRNRTNLAEVRRLAQVRPTEYLKV